MGSCIVLFHVLFVMTALIFTMSTFQHCHLLQILIYSSSGKQPAILSEIFLLESVAKALVSFKNQSAEAEQSNTMDSLASVILSHTQTHHAQASKTRFAAGPPKTAQSMSSINKLHNLSRANQVNAEWQQKKAEAKLHDEDKGVTFVASVWKQNYKSKLVEVRSLIFVALVVELTWA